MNTGWLAFGFSQFGFGVAMYGPAQTISEILLAGLSIGIGSVVLAVQFKKIKEQ